MFDEILNWWNNLTFCQRKKEEWIVRRMRANLRTKMFVAISWPKNNTHPHKEDFVERDWIYKPGDRCERYVAWFFHDFTYEQAFSTGINKCIEILKNDKVDG